MTKEEFEDILKDSVDLKNQPNNKLIENQNPRAFAWACRGIALAKTGL